MNHLRTFDEKYLGYSSALEAQKAMLQHRRCDPARGNAERLSPAWVALAAEAQRASARLAAAALPTVKIVAIKCTLVHCRSSMKVKTEEYLQKSYSEAHSTWV